MKFISNFVSNDWEISYCHESSNDNNENNENSNSNNNNNCIDLNCVIPTVSRVSDKDRSKNKSSSKSSTKSKSKSASKNKNNIIKNKSKNKNKNKNKSQSVEKCKWTNRSVTSRSASKSASRSTTSRPATTRRTGINNSNKSKSKEKNNSNNSNDEKNIVKELLLFEIGCGTSMHSLRWEVEYLKIFDNITIVRINPSKNGWYIDDRDILGWPIPQNENCQNKKSRHIGLRLKAKDALIAIDQQIKHLQNKKNKK